MKQLIAVIIVSTLALCLGIATDCEHGFWQDVRITLGGHCP